MPSPKAFLPTASGPTGPALPRRARAGFTLAEIVLAIGVTAVIGAAIASMLYAFTYGSSLQADNREAMVASEMVKLRMSETVQRSAKVLAQGTNYLVLWVSDDADGNPELAELRRIEYNVTDKTITSYKPPLNPTPNTSYSLTTTDFNAVTNAVKGTAQMPGQVWGNVTGFSILLDNATVQSAKFVGWRIIVRSDNGGTEVVVGGAALRNS